MNALDANELDPVVRHVCEQAVRSRLRAVEEDHSCDDRERLRARRRSLDLLHLSVKEGGYVDSLQIRLLLSLLDDYEQELEAQPLPYWPGAQYPFLVHVQTEHVSAEVAREELHRALAELHAVEQAEAERARRSAHGRPTLSRSA